MAVLIASNPDAGCGGLAEAQGSLFSLATGGRAAAEQALFVVVFLKYGTERGRPRVVRARASTFGQNDLCMKGISEFAGVRQATLADAKARRKASSSYPDSVQYRSASTRKPRVQTRRGGPEGVRARIRIAAGRVGQDSRAEQKVSQSAGRALPRASYRGQNRFLPKASRMAATTQSNVARLPSQSSARTLWQVFIDHAGQRQTCAIATRSPRRPERRILFGIKAGVVAAVAPSESADAVNVVRDHDYRGLRFGFAFVDGPSPCPKSCFSSRACGVGRSSWCCSNPPMRFAIGRRSWPLSISRQKVEDIQRANRKRL